MILFNPLPPVSPTIGLKGVFTKNDCYYFKNLFFKEKAMITSYSDYNKFRHVLAISVELGNELLKRNVLKLK